MPEPQHENRCDWTLERIEPYVDGGLRGAERTEVERHIEICSGCRGELALARAVIRELRSLPDMRCPDTVRIPESARAGREWARAALRGSLPRFVRGLRPATAVMLIVVVAVGAYVLFQWETGRHARLAATSVNETSYSARDLELAKIDAMTAFAYVNKYGHKTSNIVRKEVINEHIVSRLERVVTQPKGRAPRER